MAAVNSQVDRFMANPPLIGGHLGTRPNLPVRPSTPRERPSPGMIALIALQSHVRRTYGQHHDPPARRRPQEAAAASSRESRPLDGGRGPHHPAPPGRRTAPPVPPPPPPTT